MYIHFKVNGQNADLLSYQLVKNPVRVFSRSLKPGNAQFLYTAYSPQEIGFLFFTELDNHYMFKKYDFVDGYVSPWPYCISSLTATYLKTVFGSALKGECHSDDPSVAEKISKPFNFEIKIGPIVPFNDRVLDLFDSLGYVSEVSIPMEGCIELTLKGDQTLTDVLRHLMILLPVMDGNRHCLSKDDVNKLMKFGDGWLETHPKKDLIVKRYLGFQKSLINKVNDEMASKEESDTEENYKSAKKVKGPGLHTLRHDQVVQTLRDLNVKSILEFGCGTGKLLEKMMVVPEFKKIFGVEPDVIAAERAKMFTRQRKFKEVKDKVKIKMGGVYHVLDEYKDFNAIVLCEVIEHLRNVPLSMEVIFSEEGIQPDNVIITTPNKDFNRFYGMSKDKKRHWDHQFEWTQKEAENFAKEICEKYGYTCKISGVGEYKKSFFGKLKFWTKGIQSTHFFLFQKGNK